MESRKVFAFNWGDFQNVNDDIDFVIVTTGETNKRLWPLGK